MTSPSHPFLGGARHIMQASAAPHLADSADGSRILGGVGEPSAVTTMPYSAKVAQDIIDGADTWIVGIGEGFGLDLSDESCVLCGGFFPRIGDAVLTLSRTGGVLYLHSGCWRQVEDWV